MLPTLTMPKSQQHTETLRHLAENLRRRGVGETAAFVLDLFRPFDFLSSQLALFARPFTSGIGGRWGLYVDALSEETNWHTLRQLLAPTVPEHEPENNDTNTAPQ